MKKLFFFAAIAAIAVSCAKTNEVNPVSEQAIGFDTWTSNLTKSTHAAFPAQATFSVYGYKETGTGDGATREMVFNNVTVTKSSTSAWNYDNVKMWDRTTDRYCFFAIAPAGNMPANPDPSPVETGLFVTNDITFNGKYPDILVAQKKEVARAAYGMTVPLVFKPVAALFDLKFKKAINLDEATLTIEECYIQNIQSKGKLTVSAYDGNKNPTVSWSLADTPVKKSFNNTDGNIEATVPVTFDEQVPHGKDNAGFLINNLVVMPQSLLANEQQLYIKYTISFGNETLTRTRTIDLRNFDTTDMKGEGREETDQNGDPGSSYITAWAPGKHYTYYLTINADLIVFNATISDWTDANAFHYIIN